MNKGKLNTLFRRVGFEVHGLGFLQSMQKNDFKQDPFLVQKTLLGNKKVNTIFDLGANRGDIALKYSGLFPAAKIYAFEPFDENRKVLEQKAGSNARIKSEGMAVGSENKRSELFVNHNADTNSLLKSKKTGLNSDYQAKNKGSVMVDIVTLDSYCSNNGISSIDILKMDIQGGELDALRGAKNLLSSGKVGLIYTETYFLEQYENQPLFYEIGHLLNHYGFVLQDIYNPIYGKGNLAWCDAIFIPA